MDRTPIRCAACSRRKPTRRRAAVALAAQAATWASALALAFAACAPTEHVFLDRDASALGQDDATPDAGRDVPGAETDGTPPGTARACIHPATLDFGAVPRGTSATRTVRFASCGAAPLTLRTLAIQGDRAFALPTPPALPRTLPPGEAVTLPVGFSPTDAGPASGGLRLTFEGADGAPLEATLPLSGTGT